MTIKEIDVKSVMTKSNLPVSDFSVNTYVGCAHACKYCYASFMKRFTNHPEPWGDFIDVKLWPDIKNARRFAGKEAFLGSVTDCYQPCEAKYKRTRALLEQLQGSGIRISTCILGIDNMDELLRDLHWLHATEAEKDYSNVGKREQANVGGDCTYCNHCSPCTVGIPIAKVNELLDKAETDGLTPELQEQYDVLPHHAGECTHCGACLSRCPFGVDIPAKMDKAKEVFGK